LSGADLTGADLSGADLTGAILVEADLSGAILRFADLSGADLTNADLTNAVLANAVLTNAVLTGAVLNGADLTGADLSVWNWERDVTYTNEDGDTRTYAEMVTAGWWPMTTGNYKFPALYSHGQGGVRQVLDMEEGDEVLGWTVSINQASGSGSGNTDSGTHPEHIDNDEENHDHGEYWFEFTSAGDHVQEVDSETENILRFNENNIQIGTVSTRTTVNLWTITGCDGDKFSISSDGVIAFVTPPDFENPTDANKDNIYELILSATYIDGNIHSESASIRVVNVVESTPKPYQSVYSSKQEISFRPGSDVSIDLLYTTSDGQNQLAGLQLNVHYNSSLLTPVGENGFTPNKFTPPYTTVILDDTNDLDNDSPTDKMIQIIWLDTNARWPGLELPASIGTISFTTPSKEALVDPITGQDIPLNINYTCGEKISGYDFLGTSTSLVKQTFNLDVDGDGRVGAFTDGFMILRKMFGDAFDGEALTHKVLPDDATRDTDEIHEYIQAAIDDLTLDVDGDGTVGAFSDGFMILRKMFGDAFDGEALTHKAITSTATRTTEEIHEYIESLMTIDPIA